VVANVEHAGLPRPPGAGYVPGVHDAGGVGGVGPDVMQMHTTAPVPDVCIFGLQPVPALQVFVVVHGPLHMPPGVGTGAGVGPDAGAGDEPHVMPVGQQLASNVGSKHAVPQRLL